MENHKQNHSKIDTEGGVYIGGNVETGGGSFVGRDQITNDFAGRDIIYIGKNRIYSIQGLKYSRLGLWTIIVTVILISAILVGVFGSTLGILFQGSTLSILSIFTVAIAVIIGLGIIYYVSQYYLKKSNENSRKTINKLRDIEKTFFQELDKEVSSLFEENRPN